MSCGEREALVHLTHNKYHHIVIVIIIAAYKKKLWIEFIPSSHLSVIFLSGANGTHT